jgi:hypothetical protein
MTTTTTTAGELEVAGGRRQVAELYATVRQAPTPQKGHAAPDRTIDAMLVRLGAPAYAQLKHHLRSITSQEAED